MNCEEIQESLSLYCDDGLADDERIRCDRHLEVCPVCRDELAQFRTVRVSLGTMSRPSLPADLIPVIQNAVRAEVSVQRARRNAPFGEAFVDLISVWLQPRAMRYAFSSVASIILFAAVFTALRPHMLALQEAATAFEQFNAGSPEEIPPITPTNYASLRAPFNSESPSLNPTGSLATLNLANPHSHQTENNDDMVVIADVFSNGTASVADVMHAPRDRRMLDDFQAALRNNAVFVPSSLDRRAGTMRVVFSIQTVEVRDR